MKRTTSPSPSPTTRGAVTELLVAADLMESGWHVFRAISANASCDLIAVKDEAVLRIECKSRPVVRDGAILAPRVDWSRCDVLAGISPDGSVLYVPELSAKRLRRVPTLKRCPVCVLKMTANKYCSPECKQIALEREAA